MLAGTMNFINWFKFNIKRYFQLDESENSNYDIFRTCNNFRNITCNRNIIKYHDINESERNSSIISGSNKYIFKVQENSNQFFRTHSHDINGILENGFGENSLYSLIRKYDDYRYDIPKLQLPSIEDIALARQHLESGYKELNSLRIKSEDEINLLRTDLESCKSEIENKIKEDVNLNKFTFRQNTDESLPATMTVQNIYNSNLFYGIVECISGNNKYLNFDFVFPQRKDEKGEHLATLTYYKLYFVSQMNDNERLFSALGSEEDITQLKTEIEKLLNSNLKELKALIDEYYNIIDEINNNENLTKFNNTIANTCLQITTKNQKLNGKCKECPSLLDYFG